MSHAENKRLARRFPKEAATEGNLDILDTLLARDFVDHGVFGRDSAGRDAAKQELQRLRTAFPDFEATVEDIIAEGDLVAMRVTLSGTHEGEFMGIEPTGASFTVQNMVFTRIENGTIAERWTQPDTLGLLKQLGASVPGKIPVEP
jgi:steroid delta-isomerase-like uncharacterized protein